MKTDTLQALASFVDLLPSLNSAILSSDLSEISKAKMQTELLYEYLRTVTQGLQVLRESFAMSETPDAYSKVKLLP